MKVKNNNIITPVEEQIKFDWSKAFLKMTKNDDDELLIPDVFKMKILKTGPGNN